jgi:hypothetical protein
MKETTKQLIVSIALILTVLAATYITKNPNCLWGLMFLVFVD